MKESLEEKIAAKNAAPGFETFNKENSTKVFDGEAEISQKQTIGRWLQKEDF